MQRALKCGFLIVAALAAVACLCLLAYVLSTGKISDVVGLPLLAIGGVVVLIAVLAMVAIAFAVMDLSDRTEALALPSGSVRAVIALSLVVLFGILSVFLFSSLNNAKIQQISCLTDDQRQSLLSTLAPGALQISLQSAVTNRGAPCPPQTAGTTGADQAGKNAAQASSPGGGSPPVLYSVYVRQSNPASEDFAKQLLVLIGTLVTSVAGFYFGSKAVSDAQANGPGDPPTITGVNPSSVEAGSVASLTITGASLNDVTHAQLTRNSVQINDPSVVSNATQAKAKFAIPADATTGAWDIVVTDDSGRSARLAGAVTVTTPGAPQAGPQDPAPQDQSPQPQPPQGSAAQNQTAPPPDATQLAQQASAIQAIAGGVKSSLDALLQRTPLAKLQATIAQLGGASEGLQPHLAAATQALATLQASVNAATVDASRAQSAIQSAGPANGDSAQPSLAARLAQLASDAASASHAFSAALAAYNAAGDAILKQVASG